MTAISPTSNSLLSDLGLATKQATENKQALGQEDFLQLMTAQMKNQDPMKPMDPTTFLGQLAQFTTVQGIQSLNDSFSTLATSLQSNQALQASQLVGHGVMLPSTESVLVDGQLYGAVELPSSGQVTVDIADASGQIVRSIDLGVQPAGIAQFSWDGSTGDGSVLPDGRYTLSARQSAGGSTSSASTYAIAQVSSVSLAPEGLNLNLVGLGSTPFSSVKQIF